MRIIFLDQVLFRRGKRILANNGLDIAELGACEFRWRFNERLEFVEEEECRRRVDESGGEKFVVGPEEGDAVEWRAFVMLEFVR
jgi:hypothetical protein